MCSLAGGNDYTLRPGTHNDGQSYERKIAALLYLRAVNMLQSESAEVDVAAAAADGAAAPAIRLGLNVAWAGRFDDVVLHLRAPGPGPRDGPGSPREQLVLAQLKHRERKPVTRFMLQGEGAGFGLRSYFQSFCALRESPLPLGQHHEAPLWRCLLYTNARVELKGHADDPAMKSLFSQLLNTGGEAGALLQLHPHDDAALFAPFAAQPLALPFLRSFFVCAQQAREDELDELLQQEVWRACGRVLSDARDLPRRLLEAIEAISRAQSPLKRKSADHSPTPTPASPQATPQASVPFLTEQWAAWRGALQGVRERHGALGGARLHEGCVRTLALALAPHRAALLMLRGIDARLRSAVLLQVSACEVLRESSASWATRPLLADATDLCTVVADASHRTTALDLWEGTRHPVLLLDTGPTEEHRPRGSCCAAQTELALRLASLLREDGARVLLVACAGDCALGDVLRGALAPGELFVLEHRVRVSDLDGPTQHALLRTEIDFMGETAFLGDFCSLDDLQNIASKGDSYSLPPQELSALLASSGDITATVGPSGARVRVGRAPEAAACSHFVARSCRVQMRVRVDAFAPRDGLPREHALLVQGLGADQLLTVYGRRRGRDRAPGHDPRFRARLHCQESDWEAFCVEHADRPVHWLQYEQGGHFQWVRSRGDTEALAPFIEGDPQHLNAVQWILRLGTASPDADDLLRLWMTDLNGACPHPPTLLLTAGAGAGKSDFLRHAAQRARQLFPRCWVQLLDLSAVTKHLAAMGGWESLAGPPTDDPAFATVAETIRRRSAMLALVDAFDEVCPDYLSAALSAVRSLQARGRCAVWVATRPSARHRLASALGGTCCEMALRPLTPAQQRLLLRHLAQPRTPQHMLQSAAAGEEDADAKASRAADSVQSAFGSGSCDDEDGGVLGAPLHVELLAEALAEGGDDAEEYEEEEEHEAPRSPRLVDLLERLVNRKFEVYCVGKLRKDAWQPGVRDELKLLRTLFLDNHGLAALGLVLSSHAQQVLVQRNKQHAQQLRDFLNRVRAGEERTGVLVGVGEGGEPRFAHRTLAEYLAARWLADRPQAAYFVFTAQADPDAATLRAFLNALLVRGRPLHEALLAGAAAHDLRELLSARPDCVEDVDQGGRTALHLAALCGGPVADLLRARAALEAEDLVLRTTAVHYAALAQHWLQVRQLLEAGARVRQEPRAAQCVRSVMEAAAARAVAGNRPFPSLDSAPQPTWPVLPAIHRSGECTSAVHLAAALGLHPQLKELLALDAEGCARACDAAGEQPLHCAARWGSARAVALLLAAGAAIEARDARGQTPLLLAARAAAFVKKERCRRVATLLLRAGACADAVDERGNTALHWAASGGDWRLVAQLLRAQMRRAAPRNADGHTPLHLAALEGHVRAAALLLRGQTPSPWAMATTWAAPLLSALPTRGRSAPPASASDAVSVQLGTKDDRSALEESLSSVTSVATASSEDSPLHLAAWGGHAAVATALLRAGADPNKRGARRSTPLHQAAVHGHLAVIKVLLRAGADPDAADAFGERPLHRAAAADSAAAVAALAAAGADVDAAAGEAASCARPLHYAASKDCVAAITALIAAGAGLHATDGRGETALHAAARSARGGAVSALLSAGADANARSSPEGLSPLHCAVEARSALLARQLERAGADYLQADASGRSPLDAARAIVESLSARRVPPSRREATERDLWRSDLTQLQTVLQSEATYVNLRVIREKEKVERSSE